MTSVPNTIAFELHWPRLDQGGLKHWEEYLEAHPTVRLVVINTWARVSSKSQHRQRSQYEDEYAALIPLKDLADTYRVSILAIHHLRKWLGTFSGAGNGDYVAELVDACRVVIHYLQSRDIPLSQGLLRLDGLYGNASVLTRIRAARPGLSHACAGLSVALAPQGASSTRWPMRSGTGAS